MDEHWNAKIIREEAERPKAAQFKKGQRVKVEFTHEGTVTSSFHKTVDIQVEGGQVRVLDLAERPGLRIKVTHLDPADWPPQAGDIWVTRDGEGADREWFAQTSMTRGVIMRPEHTAHSVMLLAVFKALNPVLVRRRGQ